MKPILVQIRHRNVNKINYEKSKKNEDEYGKCMKYETQFLTFKRARLFVTGAGPPNRKYGRTDRRREDGRELIIG